MGGAKQQSVIGHMTQSGNAGEKCVQQRTGFSRAFLAAECHHVAVHRNGGSVQHVTGIAVAKERIG
jgi:hypothetical protein